ncbi:hypothetical protein GBA65_10690 [Rubrobacter marinus]|uniref:tRNA dimethylallyltransferase n=1 Tax=Rubrobacter marinus TaxID=2653852 RepID=A0A6G8PXI1_9ACTN|nr:hypothetical protein [Rubrobacter marinus]QIN78913.1 hypothetical protein GBA65_10690 [Rubrobacter marinus]
MGHPAPEEGGAPRRALVVCGPTAAGKSSLADGLAASLSEEWGGWVPTLVVDSMQVYEEIPETTNQRRERPAELVGVVSVEDEWTVALHKRRAEGLIGGLGDGWPFVLDAGTGMYLNAIVLGLPLAPKASDEARREAIRASAGAANPRRAAREEELRLEGAPERGSVWSGSPMYGASFVYLRPPREALDLRIAGRSRQIVRRGEAEGRTLNAMDPNPSVRQAVGPKEMMRLASGDVSRQEAEEKIAARTRRLARRQMRWFDKLMRALPAGTERAIVETAEDPAIKHIMHDIMCSWS